MYSLTPSHLIEFLYCPRFTYFEYVLRIPQYEQRQYKVDAGKRAHLQREETNKAYLRKRIGAVDKQVGVYLADGVLRGIVDEVLTLADGSIAPLDYKFTEYKQRAYPPHLIQLYCYAVLIEKLMGKPVYKGFLVYERSKHKLVEVPIGEHEKQLVQQQMARMLSVIEQEAMPRATKNKTKCLSCTYKNICPA